MKYSALLIFRWLIWLILLSFESVVGFPWLSMLVAGEWLFSFNTQSAPANLIVLSLVLSANYFLSWPISMFLLLIIWQTTVMTRKRNWWRWVIYALVALAVGMIGEIPFSSLSIFFSFISFLIFLKFLGVHFLRKPWRKQLSSSVEI